MPGGDRTGPGGMGPMTGRGAGFCAGNSAPGFANQGFGRFFPGGGRGRGGGGGGGRGRGWSPWFNQAGFPAGPSAGAYTQPVQPNITGPQEMEWLKNQAADMEAELVGIKKRIDELAGSEK